jgi:hypothetical protein
MPTSFLEIVELPDGRIELRRAEDEGSLVTLNFSEDAKAFLQGQHVEVAKAMLSVGVQMAGRLAEGELEKDDEGRASFTKRSRIRCHSRLVRSALALWRRRLFSPNEYSGFARCRYALR